MPAEEAVAIDAGNTVVVLGQLTVSERRQLAAELRAGLPQGAPQAGLGGASASDGANEGWLLVGLGFLVLSAVAGIAGSRLHRSP